MSVCAGSAIPIEHDRHQRGDTSMAGKRLTVGQRREIFEDLVITQDTMPLRVRESYELITDRYSITEYQLKQIENEGLEKEWPPLDEAMSNVA